MKGVFSDFGIPETIISDNGACYKSHEFKAFCQKFDISHQTGAACNHRANYCQKSNRDHKAFDGQEQNYTWLALLILKSTPITGTDKSPAELLCNRCFRTNIPLIQHASSLANQARLRN